MNPGPGTAPDTGAGSDTGSGTGSDTVLGTVLEGRYRVDRYLARGGMSTVYAGLDLRLDRPVAIKIMNSGYAADPSFVQRFGQEARAAAKLDHRHVVGVHDQGVDHGTDHRDDRVYLVMVLVNGGTLRDLLRERRALPVPLTLSVLEPVLSALAAAHRAGLVHRDVKPENVLIGIDGPAGGVVKVADFGLVRAIASAGSTDDNIVLGTMAYLSPEQLTTGAADARSDVYAAGIMCYEMLTGHPPYLGDSAMDIAYRHVHQDVPAPSGAVPDIPVELDDLVLRATRRDPMARPANAAEFLAELSRLRSVLGIEPVPVPVPERAGLTDAISNLHTDAHALMTARVVPALPGPIGPRGTRAISRAELAAAMREAPPATKRARSHRDNRADSHGRDHRGDQHRADQHGGDQHRGDQDHGPRPVRSGRRAPVIWLVVVLVLAALVGGGAWWWGIGQWTEVPKVAGMDTATAQSTLTGSDLNPKLGQAYDNTVPAGRIIGTTPGAGSRALRGATVTLVVSEGRPVVPDIAAGAQVDAAEQAIRAKGLAPKLDANTNDYSATVPAGTVLKVIPAAGTPVDVGSSVTIAVSKGPPPTPVPSVVGMSQADAFAALTKAGYQPYALPQQFSDQVPGGSVISTSPAAGTVIPTSGDRRVGVVVSNAVSVPNVMGSSVQDAEQTLTAAKLQVQVQSIFNSGSAVVLAQNPGPGTLVAPGTTITVTALG